MNKHYKKLGDPELALRTSLKELKGAFALGVIFEGISEQGLFS